MEVKLLGRNTRAALKLYDRRFALNLRSEYKIGPPTSPKETAFGDFVKRGGAAEFLDRLRNDDDFEEPEGGWDMGQDETFLHDMCLAMYKAESEVYHKLKDLQGKEIPYLLAEVRLQLSSSQETTIGSAAEFFEVKGILLELIDGHTLSDIAKHVPREDWGKVCEEAVRVVRLLDDFSIRNADVRPSNIMISRPASENKYRVVMLDFGQCVLREPEESDEEWGKARKDEEGAIGLVMKHKLKRDFGYDWPFEHSNRFSPRAPGEDSD